MGNGEGAIESQLKWPMQVGESSSRSISCRRPFGDQMVRAATSVAANIAEGYGRRRRAEYIRFLDIANGSRCEIETQFEVCSRIEVISGTESEVLHAQSERIGRMLTGLRSRLVSPSP